MKKSSYSAVADILESIARIEEYTTGSTEDSFCQNQEKQDAVYRRLEIIGEAARRVPQELRNEHPDIPWRRMIALRNVLAHEYDHVLCTVIWDTITIALPPLKVQLMGILDTENGE